MTPVVISYYPGSGGNRLAWHLLNLDWQSCPDSSLHDTPHPIPSINYEDRDIRPYPVASTRVETRPNDIELTHCVNSKLLKHHFPGRRIVKIKSHLARSLSRHWQVFAQAYFEQEIRMISRSFALTLDVDCHWSYYQQTGVDWDADQLYDLTNPTDEFSVFMQKNIAQNSSQEFDDFVFTWQKFKKRSLDF
jgi:hypothetical protein